MTWRMCKLIPGRLIIGRNSSSRGRRLQGAWARLRRLPFRGLPQMTLLMQERTPDAAFPHGAVGQVEVAQRVYDAEGELA